GLRPARCLRKVASGQLRRDAPQGERGGLRPAFRFPALSAFAMNKLLACFAALVFAGPAAAQVAAPPQLTLEHKMLLRCSAAFALIAYRQEAGHAEVQQYPPLKQRGSEFFVRASARVMDE